MEVLSYINNKIEEIFLTQERIVFSDLENNIKEFRDLIREE